MGKKLTLAPTRTRAEWKNAMAPPPEVQPYRRTPIFTETTVPAGLLRAHATKDGAWGLIHVFEGKLAYRITDPRRQRSEQILTPETQPGVVEPTIVHEVEPLGPVRFQVEFHQRDPGGGT